MGKEYAESCRGTKDGKSRDLGSNPSPAINILCDSLSVAGPQFTYLYKEEFGLFQLRHPGPEAWTWRLGLGEHLYQSQASERGQAGGQAWDLALSSVLSSVLLTNPICCQVLSFHLLPTGPPLPLLLHLSSGPFHQPCH